jgi:membrane-associated protease RseP (regulator of RpoE activity)
VPAQEQSLQAFIDLDYAFPNTLQNNPQPWPRDQDLNWENVYLNGNQGWWRVFNQGPGLSLAPVDGALRDHLKLSTGQGLVVTAVDPNSPPGRAGIQQNDVLVKLGETPLGKPEDLEENLKKAGEKPLSLSVLRNGSNLVLRVQPQITVTLGPVEPKRSEPRYWIGIEVAAIEPALRSQLQIPSDHGVLVNNVIGGSPAEKAGFKIHDILLKIGGKPLSDPHKLAELVQAHGQKPIVAILIRAGSKETESLEVTPEVRKSAERTTRTNPARNFYFYRPGALMLDRYSPQTVNPGTLYEWTTKVPGAAAGQKSQKQSGDAGAAVSKRLGDLDAEIKQLRKAVEGLRKTESIIDELNKAVEALNKAAKENK